VFEAPETAKAWAQGIQRVEEIRKDRPGLQHQSFLWKPEKSITHQNRSKMNEGRQSIVAT